MRLHPIIFVVPIVLCGCGSKELTRSKASDIIDRTDDFKLARHDVGIEIGEANKLVKRGYMGWQGFPLPIPELVLKPAGKKFFEKCSGQEAAPNPLTTPLSVTALAPLRREVIEITGITGLPGDSEAKVVDFKWHWRPETLPKEVLETVFDTGVFVHPDVATLKLYDDGWRFVRWGKPR